LTTYLFSILPLKPLMTDERAAYEFPEDGRPVVRSVQRTGLSSLAVTLPKAWTEAFNVHHGSQVRLHDVGEGRLELSPVGKVGVGEVHRSLQIDASDCPPQLLSRLLVGAYITGHEHVLITSRRELAPELRAEVDRIARRVLGMSLIEDEPNRLEVRVFLDPTKHRLSSLLDRMVRMVRTELELFEIALKSGDASSLEKVRPLEEEIDRFYLLMARQILLASNDFQVAREIGVPSHHYQLGYRVVVKMLEVTADLLASVAIDLGQELPKGKDAEELLRELHSFDGELVGTMEAFRDVSALRAHDMLTEIETWTQEQARLSGALVGRSRDKVGAARVQRILSGLSTARELLAIINEITINRSVEPETIARDGGRVVLERRGAADRTSPPIPKLSEGAFASPTPGKPPVRALVSPTAKAGSAAAEDPWARVQRTVR
jgi:phosphate uptake regulator